jgi:hypothetical protein
MKKSNSILLFLILFTVSGCAFLEDSQTENDSLFCGNRYEGEGFYLVNVKSNDLGPYIIINDVENEVDFSIYLQSGYKNYTFIEPADRIYHAISDLKYYDSEGDLLQSVFPHMLPPIMTYSGPRDFVLIESSSIKEGELRGWGHNTYVLKLQANIMECDDFDDSEPPPPPPVPKGQYDETLYIPFGTSKFTFKYSVEFDYYLFNDPKIKTRKIDLHVTCNLRK